MDLRTDVLPSIREFFVFLWGKFRWWNSRASRLFLSLLIGFFLLSFFLFWLTPPQTTRLYLEFPNINHTRLSGEIRYMPTRYGTEAKAEAILEELFAGPSSLTQAPLYPVDTYVRSVLYRKGILYVDISNDVLLEPPSLSSYQLVLKKTTAALKRNLPFFGKIIITIDGNIPASLSRSKKPDAPKATRGKKK
jgi:hypothetical protein